MNEYQQQLVNALTHVAELLRIAKITDEAIRMEQLAAEVPQPCIVAVVGRVKAGKSTFINALLGENLAKVGVTETTATINYFRYGIPDPDRPVRCYWRNGKITDESRAFLDSLQGNDLETLQKADGIDHLEYYVQNPYLEQIILVDTPGTGTVIEEHQNRTAEFLALNQQLRERHHQETQRIGSRADAAIYLAGETARLTDTAFLEAFQEATQGQSRSLNAIGILAKIDLSPEILQRRDELAKTLANQLQNSLNTVIPLSAGLEQALRALLADNRAGLKQIIAAFRLIPPDTLDVLLADPELYLSEDCSVSAAERKRLRGEIPWRVFTVIAALAADCSLNEDSLVQQLQEMAGFRRLHDVLDQHFVKRASLLRCYRIVNDAWRVVTDLKFVRVPEFHKRTLEAKAMLARFLAFIKQGRSINPQVAQELMLFVNQHLQLWHDLDAIIEEIEREVGDIRHALEDYNTDFESLTFLEDHLDLFSTEEINELRMLFGLYGFELEKRLPPGHATLSYIAQRQPYWERKSLPGQDSTAYTVVQQAVRRYGLLAGTLTSLRTL